MRSRTTSLAFLTSRPVVSLRGLSAPAKVRERRAEAHCLETAIARVGFRYSADDVLGSGGSPVFVYEAAEDWSPDDACGSVVIGVLGSRWVQLLAAVETLGVVVADVFAEEQSKMSLAEDQYPVGEFGSDGSYESFSEAVRLWTLGWDLHDADTGVGEDGVKRNS